MASTNTIVSRELNTSLSMADRHPLTKNEKYKSKEDRENSLQAPASSRSRHPDREAHSSPPVGSGFSENRIHGLRPDADEVMLQASHGPLQLAGANHALFQSAARGTLRGIDQAHAASTLSLGGSASSLQGHQAMFNNFGSPFVLQNFLAGQMSLAGVGQNPHHSAQLQFAQSAFAAGTMPTSMYNQALNLRPALGLHSHNSIQQSYDRYRLQSLQAGNDQLLSQPSAGLPAFAPSILRGDCSAQQHPNLPRDYPSSSGVALLPCGEDKILHTKEKSSNHEETTEGPDLKLSSTTPEGKKREGGLPKTDRRYNHPSASTSLVASAREERQDQNLSGRHAIIMFLDCDEESLSDYQCFLRQQIELFEATHDDIQFNAQKMNKAVVLGQVGIRCRYCATHAPWTRKRGAVYYSANLDGLYQAGQNMSKNHFSLHCTTIPEKPKHKLLRLKDGKRRAGGGKQYWSEAARALGVYEDRYGLRFRGGRPTRTSKAK
jgi:hypothetical protein